MKFDEALAIEGDNFVYENFVKRPAPIESDEDVGNTLPDDPTIGEISVTSKRKKARNYDEMGIDFLSNECEPYFPKGEIRAIMKTKWFEEPLKGVYQFVDGETLDSKCMYLLNKDEIPIKRFSPYKAFVPSDDSSIYVIGANVVNGIKFNFNLPKDRAKYAEYCENKRRTDEMALFNFRNDEAGRAKYTEFFLLQPYEEGIWEGYLHRPLNRYDLYMYLEYLCMYPRPLVYKAQTHDLFVYQSFTDKDGEEQFEVAYDDNGNPIIDLSGRAGTIHVIDGLPTSVQQASVQIDNSDNSNTTTATKKPNPNGRGRVPDTVKDSYTTPDWCVEQLVSILVTLYGRRDLVIYDPCCGKSRIIGNVLKTVSMDEYAINHTIIEDDLHYHDAKKNYLTNENIPDYDILITNPPFSGKNKLNFLLKAFKSNRPFVFLFPLQVLVPVDNMRLFHTFGITIYILTPAPRFLDDEGKEKSIRECGWFYWNGEQKKDNIVMHYIVKKCIKKGCVCQLKEYACYFDNEARSICEASVSSGTADNEDEEDDEEAQSKSELSVLDKLENVSFQKTADTDMPLQPQEGRNILKWTRQIE